MGESRSPLGSTDRLLAALAALNRWGRVLHRRGDHEAAAPRLEAAATIASNLAMAGLAGQIEVLRST